MSFCFYSTDKEKKSIESRKKKGNNLTTTLDSTVVVSKKWIGERWQQQRGQQPHERLAHRKEKGEERIKWLLQCWQSRQSREYAWQDCRRVQQNPVSISEQTLCQSPATECSKVVGKYFKVIFLVSKLLEIPWGHQSTRIDYTGMETIFLPSFV